MSAPMAALAAAASLLLLAGGAAARHHDEPGAQPSDQPTAEPGAAEAPAPAPAVEPPGAAAEPAAAGAAPPPAERTEAAARPSDPSPAPSADRHGADDDWEPHTIADSTWRQGARRGRDHSNNHWFEPTHFAFELRFGPYFPEVDEEFGGTGPFEQMFGNDARFYFGLELDWLPLHIPYVGSFGPGFGWGITSASGPAIVQETGAEAGSDTSLTIHPMHLSGVLRIDGPLRRYRVPIVPYVKVGLGFGLWMASGPSGTSEVGGVTGEGTSTGLHTAIGAAIALNAFDPSAAVSLREDTGIRYAYVWGEWMKNNLDGIGSTPQMHVGTSTVVLGLALDF